MQATPSHPEPGHRAAGAAKWGVLAVLAAAQFLMVLDQAVMNVAISQLVEDFDTTVTTIQTVIALYALVMAGLMLTGGKLGDMWGRRRAFAIGLCIYGTGSALTAASWSVPSLMLGWSVLEGIGAALVLPALVALVAAQFRGQGPRARLRRARRSRRRRDRRRADPRRLVHDRTDLAPGLRRRGRRRPRRSSSGPGGFGSPSASGRKPRLDWVGGVLSALGLGLVVFGVLQASNWGWLRPRDSPVEPFGFSLTPFVIAAGGVRARPAFRRLGAPPRGAGRGAARPPSPLRIPSLRGGVAMLLAQNLILMGIFFTDPALPPGRAGPRRARNRGADAARLGRPLRRRARRLGAGAALRRPDRSCASGSAIVFVSTADAAGHHRAASSTTPPSWRDGRARGRDGPDRLPARQRRPVVRRRRRPQRGRAGCRTPRSSSAPRSAPRCSVRS